MAYAGLAQLIAQLPCKEKVLGLSPRFGTNTPISSVVEYVLWEHGVECSNHSSETILLGNRVRVSTVAFDAASLGSNPNSPARKRI